MSDSERPSAEDIDDLIRRFFGAFDNRNGRVPTSEDIAALFISGAVILHRAKEATKIMTVSEFALPRVKLLTSGALLDFHEWETANTTNELGDFAVRISEYSKLGVLESHPYKGGGTKLFQLAKLQGHWRIASLCWFDSDD